MEELIYVMQSPGGWYGFTNQGYNSYDEAMIQIQAHKDNKKPYGENIIEEIIHEVN